MIHLFIYSSVFYQVLLHHNHPFNICNNEHLKIAINTMKKEIDIAIKIIYKIIQVIYNRKYSRSFHKTLLCLNFIF